MSSGSDVHLAGQDRLTQAFAQMPYPVMVLTPDGDVVFINNAFCRLWGLASPDALVGSYNIFEDEKFRRSDIENDLRRAAAGEAVELPFLEVRIEDIAHRYGSKKTGTVNMEATAFPVFGADGRVWRMVIISKDITARKNAERSLARSESRYRMLAESLADGIYEADLDGTFTYANETAFKIFGYGKEELIGKMNVTDTIHPSKKRETEKALEFLRKGGELTAERTFYRKDGSSFEGDIHVTPVYRDKQITGIRGVVRDITKRKLVDRELQKLSRLESLGKLAGGIAHDFNNLLAALYGNIDLALTALESRDVSRARGLLHRALDAYELAAKLTNHILTFSSGGKPIKKPGSLARTAERALTLSSSGSNCAVELAVGDDLWPCFCDEDQISQVIENLHINAMQAMPEGGTIKIVISNAELTEEEVPQLPPGRYLRLSVRDHGLGIPLEVHDRIFDPFFTTKKAGSGLGLSICHSIVKNHGGAIRVAKLPTGKGAEIELFLPAHFEETSNSENHARPVVQKDNRRVLYMDDEPLLREVTSEMLKTTGCEVDTAEHGEEAIELYEEAERSGAPYALVFLDLTVPGQMGGKQALEILKSRHPEIIAVATSGYSDDPIMAAPNSFGFADKLVKPFRVSDLSQIVERLLHPAE